MINLIKNRLAELLAQRQLKITKVAKDTGISRNTIT
ncbi:helix-turn-helix domain-containing protein, partial [Streptococcus canis]